MRPDTLLARLQTLLAPAESVGRSLSAEPVVLDREEWYEQVRLVYADPDRGVPGGPYVETRSRHGRFDATVPPGTVVLTFVEGPEGLAWRRCDKSWGERYGFSMGLGDGQAWLDAYHGRAHRHESQWIRRVARPEGVEALAADAADTATRIVTGAVVPLFRVHGAVTTTLAVLFLAKSDTRFRRLGLWSLRPMLLAGLPGPVAVCLSRGREGVLRAADFAGP